METNYFEQGNHKQSIFQFANSNRLLEEHVLRRTWEPSHRDVRHTEDNPRFGFNQWQLGWNGIQDSGMFCMFCTCWENKRLVCVCVSKDACM